MTRPRSDLIVLSRTHYYHCIARCVRRAYLCGDDQYTGKCFDHRKQWVIERVALLSAIFSIDVAAYAIMSNHYHLVLHVDQAKTAGWSRDEVMSRWMTLFKGPTLAQRYRRGEVLSEGELNMLDQLVEVWRTRLSSISWYMGQLNEFIARRANEEDKCKGRFWEGRFVSRGLEDLAALISCMAYVDLNPIRAGVATTLIESEYTSIQQRLQALAKPETRGSHGTSPSPILKKPQLMQYTDETHAGPWNTPANRIPISLYSYIELVENTGSIVRNGKKGFIPTTTPSALSALDLNYSEWLLLCLEMHKRAISMLNGLNRVIALRKGSGRRRA